MILQDRNIFNFKTYELNLFYSFGLNSMIQRNYSVEYLKMKCLCIAFSEIHLFMPSTFLTAPSAQTH